MFKEGLATLGILETMQRHPTAFRKIFCHSDNVLTSEDVDQTFKPKLDDPGSNNQMKQETAVMNWRGKVAPKCYFVWFFFVENGQLGICDIRI